MKYFIKLTPNETVFGFIYFLLQLLIIPGIVMVVGMMLPNPPSETILNVVFFLINFLAVLVIFRKYLLDNLRVSIKNPWHVLRFAGLGLLIYMGGNAIVSVIITLIDPEFANINDTSIMEMVQENFVLMTVGTVLLVPIVEECFYRGLMFRTLYDKSPVAAYGVSMVLFSLAHVAGYITMEDFGTLVLCFIQYLPAGFALAWAYRGSGSIYASVLIHMAVNQTGMLLMR